MYATAFFTTLGVVFMLALGGTVAGLLQVWPSGDRRWEWKRVRLLIVSTIFLAAVVAFIVFVIISVGNADT